MLFRGQPLAQTFLQRLPVPTFGLEELGQRRDERLLECRCEESGTWPITLTTPCSASASSVLRTPRAVIAQSAANCAAL